MGMVEEVSDRPRKGRGAVSNRSGRFEAHARVGVDDGWPGDGWPGDGWPGDGWPGDGWPGEDDEPAPLRTTLLVDAARSVVAKNDSPDIPFSRSVNPYRGCEHGCVYCFARPTHAFLGLSPGLDFETKLFYKPDAADLLRRELARPSYRVGTLALGANTDPYQPVERQTRLTRSILEVLAEARHPVGVVTKSALVLRDLDILASMAARGLASVAVSVTTLDRKLARTMEPRAATPPRRLETIRQLTEAGVPVAVLASPMIPGLNDHELDAILEAATAAGASRANYILLRLPLELKALFEEWLRTHAPNRAARVLKLIRDTRDGALYESAFGRRMTGRGPYAEALTARFAAACRRLGLNRRRWDLDTSQFRPPATSGQLSLEL